MTSVKFSRVKQFVLVLAVIGGVFIPGLMGQGHLLHHMLHGTATKTILDRGASTPVFEGPCALCQGTQARGAYLLPVSSIELTHIAITAFIPQGTSSIFYFFRSFVFARAPPFLPI